MDTNRRRVVAGIATAIAGSVLPGIDVKGATAMADPKLVEKLDAVFNAHMDAELAGDLDKTLATMSPNPHLVNIPTMVGAKGRAAYGRFMPSD